MFFLCSSFVLVKNKKGTLSLPYKKSVIPVKAGCAEMTIVVNAVSLTAPSQPSGRRGEEPRGPSFRRGRCCAWQRGRRGLLREPAQREHRKHPVPSAGRDCLSARRPE